MPNTITYNFPKGRMDSRETQSATLFDRTITLKNLGPSVYSFQYHKRFVVYREPRPNKNDPNALVPGFMAEGTWIPGPAGNVDVFPISPSDYARISETIHQLCDTEDVVFWPPDRFPKEENSKARRKKERSAKK